MVVAGLWSGYARSQSSWVEHGSVELWNRAGNAWQLNATEAGTASLILMPTEAMSDSTGCTIRVRWQQGFSGSNSNFTRLHWLLDSTSWFESPAPTVPADAWSVSDEHGPLSFMHLGETGAEDSIRWFSSGPSALWDAIVAPLNHAHFADPFDIELTWSQNAGSDSVQLTLAHVYEDGSRSADEWCAKAMHAVPFCLEWSCIHCKTNDSSGHKPQSSFAHIDSTQNPQNFGIFAPCSKGCPCQFRRLTFTRSRCGFAHSGWGQRHCFGFNSTVNGH